MSKHVVIIGGGVSSKHAAEILVKEKTLKVTIIQANRFVEWPLPMPAVLVKPERHPKAIAANCEKFQVKGVEYKYGVVETVDTKTKQIVLESKEAITYDALVVATGFKMPLIYPELGVTLQERMEEVKRVGEAIRKAGHVVVAGGGPVGLEVVGDIRAAYPEKKVTLVVRRTILPQWPDKHRAKVEAQLLKMRIETLPNVETPALPQLEPGVLKSENGEVPYDVFIPAYSQGANTKFLEGNDGVLDEGGFVRVNEYLQAAAADSVFAIGTSDIKEPTVMPKLEAQWKSVTHNVNAYCAEKPLKAHKDGATFLKNPPVILIGHGKGGHAFLDFSNMPPPAKCCCCGGLGGFPCCPPPCCWCCCGPCSCGLCCGPTDGENLAKFFDKMAFKSADFHFKGVGEPITAPEQQTMQG